MDSWIDYQEDDNYLTTLDTNNRYCKLLVEKEDITKTSFVAYEEVYKFLRIFFELRNIPDSFERALKIILAG